MRYFLVLLVLLISRPTQAQTPVSAFVLQILQVSTDVITRCPSVISVNVPDPNDKTTWGVSYATNPDQTCTQTVAAVIAGIQFPPPLPVSVQVASTQFPDLNGTYPIDSSTLQNMQFLSSYVAINGTFPAGQPIQIWLDTSLQRHIFPTTAEWQAFAKAIADYYALVQLGQNPATPIQIP